jgi:hypothetical protein
VRRGGTEAVAAEHVEVSVLERGEAGGVLVPDIVAFGAELRDGASMYFVVHSTPALIERTRKPPMNLGRRPSSGPASMAKRPGSLSEESRCDFDR